MGFVSKNYFYCDICFKKFDNGQALQELAVPARNYNAEGTDYTKTYHKISCCPECTHEFWESSDSNFATVELGLTGRKIFPHFEVEAQGCDYPYNVGYQNNIPKTEKKGE